MKLNGNVLRNARDRRALTQTDVAEALEMSIATVNKAENGAEIHPSTGRKLCEYLGVELATTVVLRPEDGERGDAA